MTMALCDNKTGKIYGYFGVPYPTTDAAIKLCFPDVDPWNDEVITSDHGEIWIEDLVLIPDSNYRSIHTSEIWTLEEIAEQYNQFHEETSLTLTESINDAYDDLMKLEEEEE